MKVRIAFTLLTCALSFMASALTDEEISAFGGCYFAPFSPMQLWRLRDQDGDIREFAPDKGGLRSTDGWTATIRGDVIKVRAPARGNYPPLVYEFRNGRLDVLNVDGRKCHFNYPRPLVYEGEEICPLWPDADLDGDDRKGLAADANIWKNGKRLSLWFTSPNQAGAFLSFLLAMTLTLSFFSKGSVGRILGILLSLFGLVLLVKTGSRGAMVAVFAELVLIVTCRLRRSGRLTGRRIRLVLLMAAVFAGLAFSAARLTGVRSAAGDAGSDRGRMKLWQVAPRMMCDAPQGWGSWRETGKAYTDWYAVNDTHRYMMNLVSDHLTTLVSFGWLWGGLYLFLWGAGVFFLLSFAFRGGSPIPAAIWTSLGITSFFNVILRAPTMLWIPVGSLAFLAFDRRWIRKRFWAVPVLVGAAFALAVLGIMAGLGTCTSTIPSIRRDGKAILVNGTNPQIWVLADEKVLGAIAAEGEIRSFYRKNPTAPAIGYVTDIKNLPQTGVRRLVLTGERCGEFLRMHQEDGFRHSIPLEIIFLAPDFSPAEIPLELRARARVASVIGEFAARYYPDVNPPPAGCVVVPGAEVYIPGWPRYCFAN